jgi:hypothetical protein
VATQHPVQDYKERSLDMDEKSMMINALLSNLRYQDLLFVQLKNVEQAQQRNQELQVIAFILLLTN